MSNWAIVFSGATAIPAVVGAAFSFLNWSNSLKRVAPRAHLTHPSPRSKFVHSDMIIENLSTEDIFVKAVLLESGTFAEAIPDTYGSTNYQKASSRANDISMVIPAGSSRKTSLNFHWDDDSELGVRLKKRGRSYKAIVFSPKG